MGTELPSHNVVIGNNSLYMTLMLSQGVHHLPLLLFIHKDKSRIVLLETLPRTHIPVQYTTVYTAHLPCFSTMMALCRTAARALVRPAPCTLYNVMHYSIVTVCRYH